jgi:hypothetical protein
VFLIDKSFPMATALRAAGLICLSRLWPIKENREQDSSSYQEDESSGAIHGLDAEHLIAQISERHERDNGAALSAQKLQWLHARHSNRPLLHIPPRHGSSRPDAGGWILDAHSPNILKPFGVR